MPISSKPDEITDDKILSLLGLEDRVDIPADEYYQLLQERIQKSAFGVDKLSQEDLAILSNEKKRVREQKDTKEKLKIKKTKITAESFGVKKTEDFVPKALLGGTGVSAIIKRPESSLYKPETLKKDESKSLENSLVTIKDSLNSILESLTNQNKTKQKDAEFERKKKEREKRDTAESKLEKRFDTLKKIASKIIAPVKGILDKIINFFVQIFLGRVVIKLLEWLADPQNANKIKSILRFIGDWWPALLGSYILFGTTFGRFIRGTVGLLSRFIFQIGKVAIPRLLGLIAKNPLAALVVGTSVAGTLARTGEREKLKPELEKQRESVKKTEEDKNAPWYQKLGGFFAKQELTVGQQNQSIVAPVPGAMFSGGGLAGGFVSGEKGVDKVPAMLSDGEFVMSRGAVSKFGLPFLESLNLAGGGTNKPKVMSGTTYAAGGGLVGSDKKTDPSYRKNEFSLMRQKKEENKVIQSLQGYAKSFLPNSKNDLLNSIDSLVDTLKNKSSGGPDVGSVMGKDSNISSEKVSTGSLLTDPMGAIRRIASKSSTPKIPELPSGGFKIPKLSSVGFKIPELPSPKKGGFVDSLKSATYRDAGSIYAKQMLGGFGGPVSERDLSKESQAELQKAIQRAKKRTGSEIAKAEAKIKELEASGANKTPKGRESLATQRSFLKKLKEGGIRVQYTDYADEKGNLSESAKNAKNILGQFWAKERGKKEGGGYRIEDKYDFDMIKIKDAKTGKMRDMTGGELLSQGVFGKDKTTQQRLQAAYLLNPFRGKGDVDMVLGGKRTAAESLGLTGSKTLLGGMLGISGKPKDKNTQALEAKRPWWDKMGMFGGTSAQMARDQKAKQDFVKKNPAAKLYDKPQKNKGQPYKSRFARPKNAGIALPKPPAKPKPKVTVVKSNQYRGGQRGSGAKPATQSTPKFSAQHKSGATKSASAYGIHR